MIYLDLFVLRIVSKILLTNIKNNMIKCKSFRKDLYEITRTFSCEASATDISFENQLDAISQLLYFTIAMRLQ